MIEQFKEYISGQSDNTIKNYVRNLELFLVWLKERYDEEDPTNIIDKDIKDYQRFLLNSGKASSTISASMFAIRKYCSFLSEKGYAASNVAMSVKVNKSESATAPNILSKDEFNRFRRTVLTSNNLLYIAIVETLMATGIRVNELTSLELNDLILSDRKGKLFVRNGKGNVSRTIPLNNDARKALVDYLDVRKEVDSERVFIGQRGVMTDDGVRKLIDRLKKKAGMEHLVITPHLFRHQLATELIRNKKQDLVLVKDILGHANISTLHVYSKSTEEEQAEALENLYD
ncbi:tyrosine-type recombinase/integrase [Psychrobacillus sp. L3]|uniref:tyrosine-type recombinase/integrase n=1 Tax=Psychrobacillus sp. L3 TaxID=3236891 RepID=UPI0036F3B15D